jgi:hypothetical protein
MIILHMVKYKMLTLVELVSNDIAQNIMAGDMKYKDIDKLDNLSQEIVREKVNTYDFMVAQHTIMPSLSHIVVNTANDISVIDYWEEQNNAYELVTRLLIKFKYDNEWSTIQSERFDSYYWSEYENIFKRVYGRKTAQAGERPYTLKY